jgi:dihydroorotase
MKRLIMNATYLKGESLVWDKSPLWIEDGILHVVTAEQCASLQKIADEVIDANGWIGVPAFADVHVHFREPGFEAKETLESGLAAAAKGGFTLVAAMPNTKPPIDTVDQIEAVMRKAKTLSSVELLQYAAVTIGQQGETLVDIEKLAAHNLKLFSEDGREVESPELFVEALERVQRVGGLVVTHCEDHALTALHKERPYPPAGEWNMVERDLKLAAQAGARLHLAHLSTRESVELVRQAKAAGQPVTSEVAPHHLFFDADQLSFATAYYKVNPPLRSARHIAALVEGIKDGTVDLIASDHAPHEIESKRSIYSEGSYGFSGLEFSFAAAHTALRNYGIGLQSLVKLMSFAPRTLIGRKENLIEDQHPADLVFIHLDERFIVKEEEIVSKGKNCPYIGHELIGAVKCLILGDQLLYRSDKTYVG